MRTVLAISPHCDDAEIGAGGYIARLVEEGASVHIIALSDCRESLPVGTPEDTLRNEAAEARWKLNVCGQVLDYPVRHFPDHRQAILEDLRGFGCQISPDLVLCPSPADKHQDHAVIAMECQRAFRCSIWGWLLPHNVTDYSARGFIRLEGRHVEAKIEAIACYESQTILGRAYTDPEVIRAWARTVGLQAGSTWAEGYEILREVN